jgi:rubrerythrin
MTRPFSPGARRVSARVDLFDAAAERLAVRSGRPKSQERTELLHPEKAPDFGALWACLCGADLPDPKKPCPACGR